MDLEAPTQPLIAAPVLGLSHREKVAQWQELLKKASPEGPLLPPHPDDVRTWEQIKAMPAPSLEQVQQQAEGSKRQRANHEHDAPEASEKHPKSDENESSSSAKPSLGLSHREKVAAWQERFRDPAPTTPLPPHPDNVRMAEHAAARAPKQKRVAFRFAPRRPPGDVPGKT